MRSVLKLRSLAKRIPMSTYREMVLVHGHRCARLVLIKNKWTHSSVSPDGCGLLRERPGMVSHFQLVIFVVLCS